MLVVEIDDVGLQALERAFHGLLDVLRLTVHRLRAATSIEVDIESELGSDGHFSAEVLKGLTHKLFVVERAVDLGRIKEGDAAFNGRSKKSDRILLFRKRSIGKGHSHASKPECRYFQIAFSQFALPHRYSFSKTISGPCPGRGWLMTGLKLCQSIPCEPSVPFAAPIRSAPGHLQRT